MADKRLTIDGRALANQPTLNEEQKTSLKELMLKLAKIKILALDFDGTLTDGKVLVSSFGTEYVQCSRKDGQGISLLKKAGVHVCVITSEVNDVVLMRCQKLAISCRRGMKSAEDKLRALQEIAASKEIKPEEVAAMGDDVNDLLMLNWAGAAFTVADCHESLVKDVDYVTAKIGGDHAVREAIDLILMAKELIKTN